jgi:hypothetical protein
VSLSVIKVNNNLYTYTEQVDRGQTKEGRKEGGKKERKKERKKETYSPTFL